MMGKPAVLLGLVVAGITLVGLATRNGALLALALPPLVYLAAALLRWPAAPQLSVSRTLSTDRADAGQPVLVLVKVRNTGARLVELALADTVPAGLQLLEGHANALTALQPSNYSRA